MQAKVTQIRSLTRRPSHSTYGHRVCVGVLLVFHVLLLGWIGLRNSPTPDEVAHLTAGIYIWQFGRCDLYTVNPPLVRAIAAAPVVAYRPSVCWQTLKAGLGARPEFDIGRNFIRINGLKSFWYFTLARWTCIPFTLLGGIACYLWAVDLYGRPAGLVALLLWCLSPNVLAWGATIQPDAAAAALGMGACYAFWRWSQCPNWFSATIGGVLLGLAQLSKTTWIILFVVWPFLWLVCRRRATTTPPARQLVLILFLGVYLINVGYGFDGTLQPLANYTFVSRSLAGEDSRADGGEGGNRFKEHWLGTIPIPLPKAYFAGIDLQKSEFEVGAQSYLFGTWQVGGWWYYYIAAALLKVPVGAWASAAMASFANLRDTACPDQRERKSLLGHPGLPYSRVCLLTPPLIVLLLVSSQTGFSRYFRYVLPCFPFIFVWISSIAQPRCLQKTIWSIVSIAALTSFAASSLWGFPHSMSYFNELAGGPMRGHRYLMDANIDWQQDMFYLKDWINAHPNAGPLAMAVGGCLPCEYFGLPASTPPEGPSASRDALRWCGPQPGIFAISIHHLRTPRNGNYEYFFHFRPMAMVGYSIYIYDITVEGANHVRRQMGLPELPALDQGQPVAEYGQ